ncbi:large subunit ribosomal protein L30 [Acetoanaerobium pronyense]|uniref:Large ribosomal subunit protein uL30 n=1 Tax=Acetoanaerobium pronyense TaxID=1482736 RepID=A0ABS4KJT0_9FIRM|nr:50S ribosomal protein L30 [Acetoanaerobium pronyense]MBP2028034.1 large subunit ribosomal protein L30 [Acetoanaerobium pronyense]
MANLRITLAKSVIATKPNQRKTVAALGLTKRQQTVEKPDNPQIRGMIEVVKHLVQVEEV